MWLSRLLSDGIFDSLRGRCYTLPGLEKSQKHEARIIISPSSSLLGQAHGIADVKFVLAQGLVETNQSFFVNQDLIQTCQVSQT